MKDRVLAALSETAFLVLFQHSVGGSVVNKNGFNDSCLTTNNYIERSLIMLILCSRVLRLPSILLPS